MRYTLLGGAGFVGRNLAKYLDACGHWVRVIDNLSSSGGRLPADLFCDELVIKSVGEVKADDLAETDVLVHLASKTDYKPDFGDYVRNNCAELARLFEINLHELGIKSFILISSQTVYGNAPLPYRVGVHLHPTEQYGVSKLGQEIITRSLCPVPWRIIRPTIILGPGQNGRNLYAGLIKNTVARLHAGMPPMIYGDGEQLRCFVNVRDLEAHIEGRLPLCSSIVNATSSEGPCTVNSVVERIQEIMGTAIEPIRGKFVRLADLGQRDCVSECDGQGWGPAATGAALHEYVESLLGSDLPMQAEIEAIDSEQLVNGAVRPI